MTPGAFLCRPSPLFRSGITRAVCRRLIILQQTPQRMLATAPCILIQRACCSYCCANELSLHADSPPLCHFPNNCCGVKIISFGGGGKQANASRLQGKIERRFTSYTSLDVSCVWVLELKKKSTSLLPSPRSPLGDNCFCFLVTRGPWSVLSVLHSSYIMAHFRSFMCVSSGAVLHHHSPFLNLTNGKFRPLLEYCICYFV